MYTDVDELGGEVWFGEVPAGPDGEPMPRSRHGLADATLRGMRAASVCESIGRSKRVVEFDVETQGKARARDEMQNVLPDGRNRGEVSELSERPGKSKVEVEGGRRGAKGRGGVTSGGAAVNRTTSNPAREHAWPSHAWASQVEQAIPDSGAGATMLRGPLGKIWGSKKLERMYFRVGNDEIVEGVGGEPVDTVMMDEDGIWRVKRTAPGYVVGAAPYTLLSIPASQPYGLGAAYHAVGGAFLTDSQGRRYPMYKLADTWRVRMYILPVGHSYEEGEEVDLDGMQAVDAVVADEGCVPAVTAAQMTDEEADELIERARNEALELRWVGERVFKPGCAGCHCDPLGGWFDRGVKLRATDVVIATSLDEERQLRELSAEAGRREGLCGTWWHQFTTVKACDHAQRRVLCDPGGATDASKMADPSALRDSLRRGLVVVVEKPTASATRDASKKSRALTETNVVPRGGSPGDVSEVFEGPGKSKSGGEGDGEGDGTCFDSVSAANSISTTPIERDQAMRMDEFEREARVEALVERVVEQMAPGAAPTTAAGAPVASRTRSWRYEVDEVG